MRHHAEMRQRHVAFRDPDAVKGKTDGPQPSAERQQVLKEFVALFLGRVSDEKDNLRRCVLDKLLDDVDAQQPGAAGDEGALYVFHSPPIPQQIIHSAAVHRTLRIIPNPDKPKPKQF